MSKILKLNSYSQHDELGDRDYMLYEVKYDDGHKEYVSRDIFRNLKALEIIKRNRYEAIQCLAYDIYEDYILWYNNFAKVEPPITREEYDFLKEVLL